MKMNFSSGNPLYLRGVFEAIATFEVPRNCQVGCKFPTRFQLSNIPLHCKSKLHLCKFSSLFMKKSEVVLI